MDNPQAALAVNISEHFRNALKDVIMNKSPILSGRTKVFAKFNFCPVCKPSLNTTQIRSTRK